MNRTCPDCGSYSPPEAAQCGCGRPLQTRSEKDRGNKRVPLYLAALPLILPLFFIAGAVTQMRQASGATRATPEDAAAAKSQSCVETFGVTLENSHEYLSRADILPFAERDHPRKANPLSTVVKGMVRTTCGEPLKDVVLHIKVKIEANGAGETDHEIPELKPGVPQEFERAWTGQVTSWEITANK